MHKTSTALAALLILAACSATARPSEMGAADAESHSTTAAAPAVVEPQATRSATEQAAPAATTATPTMHAARNQSRHAAMKALSCDVLTRPTANGVLVTANVRSEHDLSGEYEMVITKSGGGNAADIIQGGPFSVRGGASTALGETEIGLERRARLRVTLRLAGENGQTCSRTFRL